MKKNWTMRVAVLMVALTLITSCFVSGTFAKYITTADGNDTARVAKFGVTIASSGSLFAETYLKTANTPGASGAAASTLSVVSSGAVNSISKLVAPGTKNENGLQFAVTGTPEVDVAVTMTLDTTNCKEVFLKAANGLQDMTTADAADTFDLAADYYPVQFTLTIGTNVTTGTLSDIEAALAATAATYPAGTNLATAIGTITLTWEWDFDDNGAGTNDKADTLLGDLAAGTTLAPATPALTAGTDYNLEEVVAITIAITQID